MHDNCKNKFSINKSYKESAGGQVVDVLVVADNLAQSNSLLRTTYHELLRRDLSGAASGCGDVLVRDR